MKKKGVYGILILTLAIVFVMALATVALAGGYNPYESPPLLPTKYTTKPHGDGTGAFYNTSTNYCKTCHAVHLAGLVTPTGGYESGVALGSAWRLLRAISAEDACKFCHEGAAPHTNKNAYPLTATPPLTGVLGEHSIDDTVPDPVSVGPATGAIPDSDKGTLGATAKTKGSLPGDANLTCNTCHSVHGAGIIPLSPILREDPYGDGKLRIVDKDIDQSAYGLPYLDATNIKQIATSEAAKRGAFCADCHNLNPNWQIDIPLPSPGLDYRVNTHAHPMNTDGYVVVNGKRTKVSDKTITDCAGCHEATTGGGGGPSAFPHQSKGHKLLADDYIAPLGLGEDIHNPQRQLPNMDQICLKCHSGLGVKVGIDY